MNEIKHRVYSLQFDVWSSFDKVTEKEIDSLLFQLKEKKLLPHAGNVKFALVSEARL